MSNTALIKFYGNNITITKEVDYAAQTAKTVGLNIRKGYAWPTPFVGFNSFGTLPIKGPRRTTPFLADMNLSGMANITA